MFQSFAILPAAGRSERMGEPKLLLAYRGKTIIEHVVATWKQSRVQHVIVVVHPDDDELAARASDAGAEVIQLYEATPDMKATVVEGLAHVRVCFRPQPIDAWLVVPADTPKLTSWVIDSVLSCHESHSIRDHTSRIIVPCVGKKRGHPVLFPWPLADEVQNLGPDEGLNRLVDRHPVQTVQVDDPAILADLDTPEDYRRLLE